MPDVFTKQKRSWMMSRVRNRDTKPEMAVRSIIHRMGYRFRLHRSDLPGTPDIVLPRHRKVVLVHGCFWHHHKGCPRSKLPAERTSFWRDKIAKNQARDARVYRQLRRRGWRRLTVWQCELRQPAKLRTKLKRFLES